MTTRLSLEYRVVVEGDDDEGYTAVVGSDPTPLSGHGATPILALRELAITLADWSEGGSDRWLTTTAAGAALASQLGVHITPKSGASS